MQQIMLGRQSGQAASAAVSIERLLNAYLEDGESGVVYGTPGLVAFSTASGDCRAVVDCGSYICAVFGTGFYKIEASGSAALLGTLPSGGVVTLASNGLQCVAEVGGSLFVHTVGSTTISQVTDPDAPIARGGAWIDATFVTYEDGTDILQASAINDATNYNALDFAASERRADKGVAVAALGATLYAFGERTVEAFYYDAGTGFPFSVYKDVNIDVGLIGRRAFTTTNDALYWLAHDLTARRLDGTTAKRISTYAVAKIIKGWADPSLTVVSSHVWRDHLFIAFRNPDGCVVFDQGTGLWHERASYGSDTWQVIETVEAFGKVLCGGSGAVYSLSDTTYTENGAPLIWEMVTPYVNKGTERFIIAELDLMMEVGTTPLGQDAIVTCERSEDGRTWSPPKARTMGAEGEYRRQVRFGRQGQSRGCAFRFRISDACPRVCVAVLADVQ